MIKLKSTVGYDYNTETNDVRKLKAALSYLGYYKVPEYGITPYADLELLNSVKHYQKDNKLKVDGVVKPDGETIASISKNIPQDNPDYKGPYVCPECGVRHGGVYGDFCWHCTFK